jgi:hypothetical protein
MNPIQLLIMFPIYECLDIFQYIKNKLTKEKK